MIEFNRKDNIIYSLGWGDNKYRGVIKMKIVWGRWLSKISLISIFN
jgi:hypothetical protein